MGTRKFIVAILVALILTLCSSASLDSSAAASADDWPTFRHDLNHSGTTSASGPASSARALWTYRTGGPVWSSPAVVNGDVYVGCRDGNVYCFDGATGEKAWSTQTGSLIEYSSPAVVGGRLYIGLNDGHVCCLDADNGDIIWKAFLPGLVRTSPAVAEGKIYVGCWDSNVYCIDASNGSQIWSYSTQKQIDSSPAVVDGVVYVGSDDNYVYALDASTGTKIWVFQTGGTVTSSPSVTDGYVYVGAGNGDIYGLNASTGERIWMYHTETSVVSSPAVANGRVFIGSEDGNLYCLNAFTGTKIWQSLTGYWVFSSPAVADGYVYVGSEDGNIYCFDASTGAKMWIYPTGDQVDSSPAIADGCLYVGSADYHVYALSIATPQTTPPPTGKQNSAVLVFDAVAVAIAAAIITAFALYARSFLKSKRHVEAKPDACGIKLWVSAHADAVCILAILAFSTLFFLDLGSGALWIADEQTYSQWAFHMFKTGDYLTPWAFGGTALWMGKPPLTMWLMSFSYQLFGVNNFATRFWSAVFGTLSCIVVFYLGKELRNRQVGLLSAIILGTFTTFFSFARHAMTDVPLVFFMVASIYFLLLSQKPKNAALNAALSGLFFGLALMTKQVGALLIPLILFCYITLFQRSLRFLFTKRVALFLGAALLIFAPWLIYMNAQWGSAFWDPYFLYNSVSRSFEAIEGHTGGIFYYYIYLVSRENTLWVILLPFAVGLCLSKALKRSKENLLLIVWMAAVLLVFSVAQTKIPWYILPAFPAFALAIGSFLYQYGGKLLLSICKRRKSEKET